MSETVHRQFESTQNDWYRDQLFVRDYQFLSDRFPHSVKAVDKPYEVDGRRGHEFILQVGEPMHASDVFGGGRSLEVGGPSDYRELKSVKGIFRPTIVTNVDPGEGVDEIADAAKLPYPDSSFRAVLSKDLPGLRGGPIDYPESAHLRSAFLHEAYRVLEPAGMLLMAGASKEDLAEALDLGFSIELGNGCIIARLASTGDTLELIKQLPAAATWTSMGMEILLHK